MNKPINRAAERLRKSVVARPQFRDESPENPPRHRGRVGQRRYRGAAEVLRLYRQQYQGQADEFGVHRHDRGQFDPEKKADGSTLNPLKINGFSKIG